MNILKKFGIESVSDVFNWVVTFSNTLGKETTTEAKKRMPGFLGLSLEDERLFAALRVPLIEKHDKYLTNFLMKCEEHERNRFRNVVAGMPTTEEKTNTGTGTNKKVVTKQINKGTDFLKKIAEIVEKHGCDEAYHQCLSGGIIIKDPIHRQALEEWSNSVKWFKEKIIKPLSMNGMSNFQRGIKTIDKTCDKLAGQIQTKFKERNEAHEKRPLWKKILW